MAVCSSCGSEVGGSSKFCTVCGKPVTAAPAASAFCTSCGSQLAANTRFCMSCGAPAATAAGVQPLAAPVAAPAPGVEPVAPAPAPVASAPAPAAAAQTPAVPAQTSSLASPAPVPTPVAQTRPQPVAAAAPAPAPVIAQPELQRPASVYAAQPDYLPMEPPRRGKLGVIVLILLLVIVAGALGGWYFWGVETVVVCSPPTARVFLDGQELAASTSGRFVISHLSRKSHLLKVKNPGYADTIQRLDFPLTSFNEWVNVTLVRSRNW